MLVKFSVIAPAVVAGSDGRLSPAILAENEVVPELRKELDQELPGEQVAFSLVVCPCPSDSPELDLDRYVRLFMDQIQRDLGQGLRWMAVHHREPGDTVYPHAHILIRGLDVSGAIVSLPEEYIASDLRRRAVELANEMTDTPAS